MVSSSKGDPSKRRKMSVGRKRRKMSVGQKKRNMSVGTKRQLVHELSKDPDSAFDALNKWKRDEILQVLRVESGEQKKYNRLKKELIIKKLLKIVSEEKDSSTTSTKYSKRRRKNVNPTRFESTDKTKEGTSYCINMTCQAIRGREDLFCKWCSCCICLEYAANKHPSIWLTCDSDPPFPGESCGFSCHLHCAIKSEKSGLKEDNPSNDVDGCFYCVSCGKKNSLLKCWKNQLLIVMETIDVEMFCFHLVLAQKLLKGTEKYRKLAEIVEEAVKSLETELCGPLANLPSTKCKRIVKNLVSAPKVKDLCSSALKSLQDIRLDDHALPCQKTGTTKISFEDVHATSLTLILGSEEEPSSPGNNIQHSVWHRKVSEKDYQNDLTCTLVSPNTRFLVSGLTPATEYWFKVVSSSGGKQTSVEETKVSTKTSQEEEEEGQEEATNVNSLSTKDKEQLALKETVLEKSVNKDKSSSSCYFGLEDCVKILRQLEFSGYVDTNFRQKFLTWYSLNANGHEKNVVKSFVDAFEDEPAALAEQLIDTFSAHISRKRSATGGMKQRH